MKELQNWWLSIIARSLLFIAVSMLALITFTLITVSNWVGVAIFGIIGLMTAAIQPSDTAKPRGILRHKLFETPDSTGAPRLSDSESDYYYRNDGIPPLGTSTTTSANESDRVPSPPALSAAGQ